MRGVFVLAVLHDIHKRTEGYTYWHILKLLNAYRELKEHGHSWIRDRAAQFFEEPFALSEEGESG